LALLADKRLDGQARIVAGLTILAAGLALRGGQVLALEHQAAALLGAEVDPHLAGCRRQGLLENANLLLHVVEAPHHPFVDGRPTQ